MKSRSVSVAVFVAVLSLMGPFGGGSAPASAAVGEVASKASGESPCLIMGDDGVQIWDGESTPSLDKLGNALQDVADRYQDEVAGVAYCSHFEGATIFVSAPSADLLDEIDRLTNEALGLNVEIHEVAAGLTELLSVSAAVADDPAFESLMSIGPDMYTGGLRLGVSEASRKSARAGSFEEGVRKHAGRAVPLAITSREDGELLVTRFTDTDPYWMGGYLRYEWAGATWGCSSGLPITVNGGQKLLTAGHCDGSSFFDDGNLVGTTYTTAFPGNADVYGDWKLIQGSSYAKRVFSGGVHDTKNLPITGAAWGGRPNGSAICTSGMATGQVCRYYVIASYQDATAEGVATGHNLEMRHDSAGGSNYDNNGAKPGDSGGPCYYADGSGGVIVVGVMSSHNPTFGLYDCAQLSGVRAWNSGAVLG